MHQSIPAAPSPPPPGLLRGIFPPCQSRGWGTYKFCAALEPGICQPRGRPRVFDTHAVSYQNITTQRILLEKQLDWLICQRREKIEEVCKSMFSILCMHFFIALLTQNYIAKSGAIDVNQRFLGFQYWIKFPLILFEENPFIFIKLFCFFHNSSLNSALIILMSIIL